MKWICVKNKDGGFKRVFPNPSKYSDDYVYEECKVMLLDENDEPLKDENGDQVYDTKTVMIKKPFSECEEVKKAEYEGLEWFVTDQVMDKSKAESRKQFYLDDDNKVQIDEKWEKRLMPDQLIKKKHLDKLGKDLDEELEKETPDMVKVYKKTRELDKCRLEKAGAENESTTWVEIALNKCPDDKPKIKEKLQKKLDELKNGK